MGWYALSALLLASLGGAYFVINDHDTEASTAPAVKVEICPWEYMTFEHIDRLDTVNVGNWQREVKFTDQYTRPIPGRIELAANTPRPRSKVLSAAKPYQAGAIIDTIYNIRQVSDECYYLKH